MKTLGKILTAIGLVFVYVTTVSPPHITTQPKPEKPYNIIETSEMAKRFFEPDKTRVAQRYDFSGAPSNELLPTYPNRMPEYQATTVPQDATRVHIDKNQVSDLKLDDILKSE